MNVRYCNRISKIKHIFPAVFLIILAAFLVTPTAVAGKPGGPKCNPHKTTCSPNQFPGGNQPDTFGYFGDSYYGHIISGDINFIKQGLDIDSGDFIVDGDSPEIVIDTSNLSKVQKGSPKSQLCDALNGNTTGLYPDSFSYGWVSDCTGGSCSAEIRMSFTQGITSLTNEESNQLDLVMYAVINDSESANPFAEEQNLFLTNIQADYKKPGTTRTLVQCLMAPQGLGGPQFYSSPRD